MKKFVLKTKGVLLDKSREILFDQIGTIEATGHNDGPKIREYLESVGLKEGSPYCAAGQYDCFVQACQDLNLPYAEIPLSKTGLANAMFNDAMHKGKETEFSPQIDDLVVWEVPGKTTGHIARIVQVLSKDKVKTVEFNTSKSAGNQRDGQGVFPRIRTLGNLGNMICRGLIGFERV
jgi:hypothetical protein